MGDRRIRGEDRLLLAIGTVRSARPWGMDVRVAAIATIIAIIVSSTVEMMVMMRKRTMNVDAPSDTQ